ncbi:MAG: von Willebrand factor type A domain-containing protein [Bacteroidota bacterium]
MSVKSVLWMVLIGFSTAVFAQKRVDSTGSISGNIADHYTKKSLDHAAVHLELNGIVMARQQSNDSGNYIFRRVKPGVYVLKIVYAGYANMVITDLKVIGNQVTKQDIFMQPATVLKEVTIVSKRPLVNPGGISGTQLSSKEVMRLPQRSVNSIANLTAGVDARAGGRPNIRGSRNDGTAYYIDGVRVQGDHSNERYKKIEENSYTSAKENPLSTFSIDVDKASYANVRRYINSDELPPADAVRIEEMINYFTYDVAVDKGLHPFGIRTEVADAPWDADKKLVYISLKAPEIDMSEAPQNNLTFLIDVSGSMQSSDKLPLLRECLKMLTEKLRDQDKICIVVYAGAAGLVLKPTPGKNKEEILDALNKLEAGGSTAGGEGIELAYKIAAEHFVQKGNNRIILATDGDFNVGISNVSQLEKLIEKKRESGIYLSVLGFGTGNTNDELMETIADKGNGNYNYIDGILEGKKVLINEMGGTLFTVAKDVKIQIEFNPKFIRSYKLIGYENRMLAAEDFNNDKKDAGELGAGHCVTAIYEVLTKGSAEQGIDTLKYQRSVLTGIADGNEMMNIKVRYKRPEASASIRFDVPVLYQDRKLGTASVEMRFAMSVALFGLKLRDSKSVKNISYEEIVAMGKAAKGPDDNGYRAEFIKLVETAELLAKRD